MTRKPRIAITIGDFNGVGPEVILKSITDERINKLCSIFLIGSYSVLEFYNRRFKIEAMLTRINSLEDWSDKTANVIDVCDVKKRDIRIGKALALAGRCAAQAIQQGVDLCLKGYTSALVTGPLSKESLNLAGYRYPGQTEMLASLTNSERVIMMLVSKKMKVGLVTTHVPISKVVKSITKEKIIEKIEILHASLKRDFRMKNPSIAVLALNPHAGDRGVAGSEDDAVVRPAIQLLKRRHFNVGGPFPADSFFGNKSSSIYDAVLAMYHDQGLIPMKMSSFGRGVNFSAGLRIIRTSPDHGTAYDIAGKGIASADSMKEAIKLAVRLSRNRL
jgi:4-hydroxythreonine-4-phosphate dehydrogenase